MFIITLKEAIYISRGDIAYSIIVDSEPFVSNDKLCIDNCQFIPLNNVLGVVSLKNIIPEHKLMQRLKLAEKFIESMLPLSQNILPENLSTYNKWQSLKNQ